jgi:hypothetical protein
MTCQICDRAVFEFVTNDGLGGRLGPLGILGIESRCKEALSGTNVHESSATMGTCSQDVSPWVAVQNPDLIRISGISSSRS